VSDPFIFVGAPSGSEGQHALFAACVRHWPFDRLAAHVWVDRDDEFKIQIQLLDRHLRFITALHPGRAASDAVRSQRLTVDLRYLHRPGSDRVECVLVGKACAPEAEAARAAALELWRIVSTIMPVGFELAPAATQADFSHWAGLDIARHADERRQWAEVRRPTEFLLWSDEALEPRFLPVVYPFRWEPNGWEVVWTALARLDEPALISVSLRPEFISDAEELIVSDLTRDLLEVAEEARPPLSTHAGTLAEIYQGYLRGLRTAFHTRVLVLGAPALRGAVRGALSGPAWSLDPSAPSGHHVHADVVEPTDAELPIVQTNFGYLEQEMWGPNPWGHTRLVSILERLRYLTDAAGALSAFRLPLLPPAGLPSLTIGEEIELPPLKTEATP